MIYVVEIDGGQINVLDASGNLIDPAKEGTLGDVKTILTAIRDVDGVKKIVDALPTGSNVIGKVDQGTAGASLWKVDGSGVTQPISAVTLPLPVGAATEVTLLLIKAKTDNIPTDPAREGGNLADVKSLLTAIKDVDGVKKIVDPLPSGSNEVGKVAQGTKGSGSNAWPQVLYDVSGNAVGVVSDGVIYRLQVDGKVGKGSSALVHLESLDVSTGVGRLKSTLYTPEGEAVAFASVSPNPSNVKNDFVKNAGSSTLLVNGSVTPVVFEYLADSLKDISLQEIKFTLAANGITFGTSYFGGVSGPLSNGLLVEVIANGNTGIISNLVQNEDFVNFAGPGGFEWVVSSKDLMSSAWLIGGGLKLIHGTSDKIRVTVRDNLTAAGVYFKCFVKGNMLG